MLRHLAARIREINSRNGFAAPTWELLPTKAMLVVTELNEACDAVRGKARDPLSEELADIEIRLVDILESIWPGQWHERGRDPHMECTRPTAYAPFERVEVLLWPVLRYVSRAVEAWRYNEREDSRTWLELAAEETRDLAAALGVDLALEMRRKLDHNALRGRFHGKARGDG